MKYIFAIIRKNGIKNTIIPKKVNNFHPSIQFTIKDIEGQPFLIKIMITQLHMNRKPTNPIYLKYGKCSFDAGEITSIHTTFNDRELERTNW